MSYMFLVSTDKPTPDQRKKFKRIAKRHGVSFVEHRDATDQYRRWFDGPNHGEPFDSALRTAVSNDMKKAGL